MLIQQRLQKEADPLIEKDSLSSVSMNEPPGKTTPKDVLAGAIFERCIAEAPLIDRHNYFRKFALAVSILTSLSAGAGFIPISLRLPAGFVFAAANFIGFFKLDIWAIRGTIDDILGPRSEKEIVLLDRASAGTGKCFKTAIVVASTIIALLSQVPVALPALDYDGKLGIPATVCLFIGGMLIPIRSLQLSINKTIQSWNNHAEGTREMELLRETMGSMIEQRRDLFRRSNRSDQQALVNRLGQSQGSDLEKTTHFVEVALEESLAPQEPSRPSLSSRVARTIGLWIAGSLQTALAIYTFEKTKEHIVDNSVAAGILAGSVVLSGVYLSGKSILDTTERITNSCLNTIRRHQETTLAEQFRPTNTRALKIFGFVVDLGALGATTVIWGDFYKNNLSLKAYFTSTLCLAYFLFLSTSTLDMINEVVEESIQYKGSAEEQQIIALNTKLKTMQKLIGSSHFSDLRAFVEQVPISLKTRLLEKIGLSTQSFDTLVHSLQEGP